MKGMLKTLFLVFFQLLAYGGFAQESDLSRKQLFNYDWKFYLGDTVSANTIEFVDANWRDLDLPHDWSIEGNARLHEPSGNDGGYFPTGIGWYRKSFEIPKSMQGKKIVIYFEGIYMNAEVFINGKSLGIYPYGYTSFDYDLTDYLYYDRTNVIAVKVDNSKQKNSRWYSGSGIYRNVWLITTNKTHIAHWGIGVTAENISEKKADVKVETRIQNETQVQQRIRIETTIFDEAAKKVSSTQKNILLKPESDQTITQLVTIANPSLWSPENPYRYQASVRVMRGKETIDNFSSRFGIRSINFSAEKGFELNGKVVKLNGGNVHHDNGSLGAAAYDRAEVRKAELLKSAGFNAVRTAHNPPSEKFLDACDSIGLLVIDEAFDGWRTKKTAYDYAIYFDEWAKRDVQAMVKRDRNHPSIILWSIGNEIIERKEKGAVETAKMLSDAVKEIDTSRPVTSAMTTWDKDWEIFDALMAAHDVCGYNYQLHRAEEDHKRVPSRIIVQTESYPRDAFANWQLVQENAYIIGDFVWTAMDYLGESGIGRWYYTGEVTGEHYDRDLFPWHAAYCGDIDLTGWRKPISHYREILYCDTPKIHLAVREPHPEPLEIQETLWSVWPTWTSWSWSGYEGKVLQVEAYSTYPKVRLYLNDQLLGEKETTQQQEFKAVFDVPYTEGTLKAVALDENNREAESKILKSAGASYGIKLSADRSEIAANGQDLSYITVEITDAEGLLQPNTAHQLHVKIDGPGKVLGIDNADIKDTDPYVGVSRKTWKGRALIVVKGSRHPGDIKISVCSPGLQDAEIKVKNQ